MAKESINPWFIVAFCCLMQAFTVGIGIYSFALFVVPWMHDFSVERSSLMVAITGSSIASALLAPVAGWIMDKYDSKKLILISLLLFSGGLVAIAMATNHWMIILIFFTILPIGMIFSGSLMAFSITARRVQERRGLAMGLTALGTSLGGFTLPFIVTQLLDDYPWRTVFLCLAGMVILLVFIPALFVLTHDEPAQKDSGSTGNDKGSLNVVAIFLLGICFMVPSFLFIAVLHNVGAFALDIGISQKLAAVIISVASISMAIGKVLSGTLSDKLNNFLLYLSILFILGIAMVITSVAENFGTLLGGVSLLALCVGGVVPLIANIISQRWPVALFGRVMGMASAFAGLSGIGSLVAAFVRDSSGSYMQAFLWLSVGVPIALFCFILLGKFQPAETNAA